MRTLVIVLFAFHAFSAIFAKDVAQPKNQKLPKKNAPFNQIQNVMKMLNLNANSFIRTKTKRNETKCDQDIKTLLNDAKNGQIWAMMMLDAIPKIPSSIFQGNRIYIGNFDSCLNVTSPYNFTGQYCLLSINPTKPTSIEEKHLPLFIRYPLISTGICVPSSCSKEYVERVIQNLDFPLLKKNISEVAKITIEKGNCQKLSDEPHYSTLNWFTIFVLSSIVALAVVSTIYEMWRKKQTFLSPFSLINNVKVLFSSEKSDPKNTSITGYRAINSFLIIFNHLCINPINGNIQNSTYTKAFKHRDELSLFFQMTFNAVDSFLTLAGAMTVIKFVKTIQTRKEYDPVWEVINRHIRFTIPIAIMLLIRIGISEHLHVGPVYPMLNEYDRRNCKTSIFSILLGYDNLIFHHPHCLPHLWHISLDIQLFLISQLILIATIWKKQMLWILSLTFGSGAIVTEFLVAYIRDLGPSVTIPLGIGETFVPRGGFFMNYLRYVPMTYEYLFFCPTVVALFQFMEDSARYYTMPHTRASPWFAGMLLGYFLVNHKDYRPNKKISAIMWIMTVLSMSVVYFAIGWFDIKDYQQPAAALYLSGHRVLWGFGSCWIIYTLYTNISGPLGEFLSYGMFDFYGRISFEMYIVHFPLMQFVMAGARETIYVTIERQIYEFFPITFYSTILAVILALFVTIPCNKILQQCSKNVKIWPIRANNIIQVTKCS